MLVFFVQWKANYPCTGCGSNCGLLTASSGRLSDGSGSSNYAKDARCEWMIASINHSVITLQFDKFSTQPFSDVVQVFQCSDLSCSQQQLLAELSGMYPSIQSMTSTTGYMKVVFTTDDASEYDGFTASWNMVCNFLLPDFEYFNYFVIASSCAFDTRSRYMYASLLGPAADKETR
jgi:hypothetical protein